MSDIQLYNTLGRKKEVFRPIEDKTVRLYSCGPTVYWFAHIGNLRAFLITDFLRRVLAYNGFNVRSVMNITDVGHLVGDSDEGEDKMIVAMRREGKTATEIARFYEQAFLEDIKRLNILPADTYCRATEHIPEQIALVEQLEKNGFTYKTSDGIYFDTSKLASYGQLSGQTLSEKEAGARVAIGDKKHGTDFALWKFSPKDAGSQREMEWDSPWGVGFPGWHVECSAMSKKYLGVPFDIHTGGVDHIAVHHENEIAQTLGADGVLEANVWLHNEMITVDGGKMAKSLNNIYTIKDLEERGYDPLAYRYFVLGAHYRRQLNFSFEALDASAEALRKLKHKARQLSVGSEGSELHEQKFLAAVNDDMNLPQSLAALWEMLDDNALDPAMQGASLRKFDSVLGLGLETIIGVPLDIPEAVVRLVEEREQARLAKDWKKSDELRDLIIESGYLVEDTADGPEVRLK